MDMNVGKVSQEYLNAVCEGCLSPDRHLQLILNSEIKKVFFQLINENDKDPYDTPLKLCFECKGKLHQFLTFKEQVKEANDVLFRSTRNPSIFMPSLSKLKICLNVTDISIKPDPNSELAPQEALTFIKIEDDYELDDEVGVGDEYNDEIEVKDLQIELKIENDKSQETNQSADLKEGNRSKKKNQEDDFSDSDEEPLNKKKKGTEKHKKVKRKDRRKNKEHLAKPKVDRRTLKQEEPPGVVRNARVLKKLRSLNVDEGQLEMVVLSWEETPGGMVCSVCKIWSKDAHALCAHRRRHRVRWRCVSCGAWYSRAGVAADHVSRAHGAPPPKHVCSMCGQHETSLGKLRRHLREHSESQKCELCGKSFRDRTSLKTHLFIHKGEKEYACPQCNKQFLFKKAMELHMVSHDASAQLYCYECDTNFKNQISFTQHMKYSLKHVDPAKLKYACNLCDKKFYRAARLAEHNLAIHLKATHVRCTVPGCNFGCSSRTVLRTHIRMIHRNARHNRNHVCHTCGKTYTTKKCLEGHIRSHTGERPFKCPLCPSTFGYEAALYNHNRLVHLKAKVRSRQSTQELPTQVLNPSTDVS